MSLLFSTGVIAGSAAKGAPGMVLLKPTSIANSGGTATLEVNGQVTFSAVNSVSFNDVFTADYLNYVVVGNWVSSGNNTLRIRLRAAGTDASGASDYINQRIESQTSVVGSRATTDSARMGNGNSTSYSGAHMFIYEPFLAEKTAFRSTSRFGINSAAGAILDHSSTHQLTTSYDGFTFYPNPVNTTTGSLAVYGVKQ